jgi:hypothetical protein
VRPFRGCTGRWLSEKILANAASCAADISIGVLITSQRTPSVQGGVVNDPV